jgi:hypothetical protein
MKCLRLNFRNLKFIFNLSIYLDVNNLSLNYRYRNFSTKLIFKNQNNYVQILILI